MGKMDSFNVYKAKSENQIQAKYKLCTFIKKKMRNSLLSTDPKGLCKRCIVSSLSHYWYISE